MNTRTIVADMRQGVLKIREDTDCESLVVRDTCFFYHYLIHTDRRLVSK